MSGSRQVGPDALVEETVRGARVRCYADRPGSVVEVLEGALLRSAGDVLLVDPALDRSVTYGEFADLVAGAAAALASRGLTAGDRVAVLARNGLEAAVAIWACARAGLVHVGLPHDAPPARLAELVALTGPGVLLAQPDLPEVAGMAALDVAEVLLSTPQPWQSGRPLPDQDETYCLIATSGTTGRPKAVRVTGRMTGHAAAFYDRALGLTAADRTAIHLPFAWVSGHVTQLAPAVLSGGSVVTMAGYSPGRLVDVALSHGVTWLDVVPSIWEGLLRSPGFGDLVGLRLAVFGGAPAPPGTLDRVRDRLPGLRLHDVYALSETCAPVSWLSDAEGLRRPGSVGRPVAYAEVRVVDPYGVDVAREEPGELWVRSPAVTPGYWGDEPCPVTPDGWLRTGDLGRMDGEGYLSVDGRAVDLIIRGGVNVYPAEVERALLSSELLADAAAVGIASRVSGQNVAAAVVALPGRTVSVAALQRVVRDRLGAHAVPRPLRVVADLPRNGNGKVDRTVLTGWFDRDAGG